jgi:hypothetical protein
LLHAIKVYVTPMVSLVQLTDRDYHDRYNDPSAEPVVAHRRPKTAKQTTASSQGQLEDSATHASQIETDVHLTDTDAFMDS